MPPYLRVDDPSTWTNRWDSLSSYSAVMPMPVSTTWNTTWSRPSESSRPTDRVTVPLSVNLAALESRLGRICYTLVRSENMRPRPGATRTSRRFPLAVDERLHRGRDVASRPDHPVGQIRSVEASLKFCCTRVAIRI